jgi:predicted esterase
MRERFTSAAADGSCGRALHIVALALGLLCGCRDLLGANDDDGTSCTTLAECGEGEVCISGTCGMPGSVGDGGDCSASRDCQDGLYCAVDGECTAAGSGAEGAACAGDGDCEGGLRCERHGFGGTCAAAGAGEPGGSCASSSDCLAGLYCGADSTCVPFAEAFPPFVGAKCTPPGADEAFRPYFEVPRAAAPLADFYRLPFPDDVRVAADGTLDMSDFPRPGPTPLGVDLVGLYVDALVADFEGFSASAVVTFRFAGVLDFASASGSTVQFVDITDGGAGHNLGESWSYHSGRTLYSCESRLSVRADVDPPLEPKHTYAVILTTGLKSDKGEAATQDADFAALLAPTRPADAALGHAWDAYAKLRSHLAAKGTAASTIAAAAVFTVQDTTGHMQRLAAAVAAQPHPVLKDVTVCGSGVTSPCDDGTPAHACPAANPDFYEIHGRIAMPIFQAGTAPYATPEDGGGIVEDASGVPQVQRTEDVCFALTVPKSAAPAAGWPLVVTGHGTGGSMRSFVAEGVAAKLAGGAKPAAVLGFDEVEHGARRGGSSASPDDLVFNVLNPRAARDNLLQGAADVLTALDLANVAPFDAGAAGSVHFDASKVAYFGHSQGSSSGEPALAFSDAAGAAVFSGAGSFLTSSLLDKTSPVNVKAGMTFLLGDDFDGEHPVMTIFQTYFDRADPLSYVHLLVKSPPAGVASKHVLMTYGKGDTYTPKSTLQHNARAMGIPGVSPEVSGEGLGGTPIVRPIFQNLRGGDNVLRTAACFQYEPTGYDGHFVAQKNAAAVSDWSAFLGSYFTTGMPDVP